jgi:lysophospholipase L1-like esterase
MHLKYWILSAVIFIALNYGAVFAQERPTPPPPKTAALPAGLNVLVIGDSNTEIGHIAGGVAKRFEENFGYFGSGYHSLNATIGMGSGYLPYLKITNDTQWEPYTMLWPKAAAKPYLAPEGTGITSSKPEALTTVEFYGNAIDVYWLAQPNGGRCVLSLDGEAKQAIDTKGDRTVRSSRLGPFPAGWHKLSAILETGSVMLLGCDARLDSNDPAKRTVIHKWGKGWATTRDFVDVDPAIFASALKLVQPDVTVILLGTNDHNLAGYNRDQYAANLREIVTRVKSAVPTTRVLVLSTFQVNSGFSNSGLKEYLGILPELCRQIGANYWDMSTWFGGPWAKNQDEGLMLDAVHVNQKGGDKIAGQLYEEILKVAEEKPGMPVATPMITEGRNVGKALPENAVPRQIPGLIAWWSADGQIIVDESGKVIRWTDTSGTKADAVAPWPLSRPQYLENAFNGKPLIHFDGKTSHLLLPMQTEAQTIFAVLRADKLILGHPHFNTRPYHPGVVRTKKAFSQNYASKTVTGGEGFLNGAKVHIGDDQDDAIEFNPKELQLFSLVMTAKTPFSYLGWGGSWNFDRYLNGDMAELLVYNRALTESERKQVEKDLAERWKINMVPEKL